MLAVPASAGETDTTLAAVNGPPRAVVVRSTLTTVPAIAEAVSAGATGRGLTLMLIRAGADAPNGLLSV